jgi:hypothetical protein
MKIQNGISTERAFVNENWVGRLRSQPCSGTLVIWQYSVAITLQIINNYHYEKIKCSKRNIINGNLYK